MHAADFAAEARHPQPDEVRVGVDQRALRNVEISVKQNAAQLTRAAVGEDTGEQQGIRPPRCQNIALEMLAACK